MSCTEAWGLCDDDSLKTETMELCSDDYITISFVHESCYFRCLRGHCVLRLLAHFYPFVSQYTSIGNNVFASYDWSVVLLLSTHPIANDVLAVGLTRKAIYYLVNYNIRVIFFFKFLGHTYALPSVCDSYSIVLIIIGTITYLSVIFLGGCKLLCSISWLVEYAV